MRNTINSGFTLVELLVVLTIMALLISISMVAMASYKDKAQNSKMETVMVQVRAITGQIHADYGSYVNVCGIDGSLNEDEPNLKIIKEEVKSLRTVYPSCFGDSFAYCVEAPLFTGGFFCVDSGGVAKEIIDSKCNAGNIKCE